jgi:hypothetical protein
MNQQYDGALNQIERILLLRIKTMIIRNLKREDIPDFSSTVLQNDPNLLLKFAEERIPELSKKINDEIIALQKQLRISI